MTGSFHADALFPRPGGVTGQNIVDMSMGMEDVFEYKLSGAALENLENRNR